MANFVIIGDGHTSIQRMAIFRDIVDGKVPNAHYLHTRLFCMSSNRAVRFLVGKKFEHLMERYAAIRFLGKPLVEAATRRMRPNIRQLRPFLSEAEENYIILSPVCNPNDIPPETIDTLRSEPLCHHVLVYFIDSIASLARYKQMSVEDLFSFYSRCDAAFTYSFEDTRLYGSFLRYVDIPIWKACPPPKQIESALYFCGVDKRRMGLLISIKDRLEDAGLRGEYIVFQSKSQPDPQARIPTVDTFLSYAETLEGVFRTSCILEIISEDNNAPTLRYKEAVMYNKKLLTNNPNISSLPYYDSRWMRTFRTAEDIGLDWLRAAEPVDYGYRGDFSVETFLRRIEEYSQEFQNSENFSANEA